MDLVKCPKCSAEQEVYVNAENKPVCAFCGEEITELPKDFDINEHIKESKVQSEEAPLTEQKPEGKGEEIYVEYTLSFDDVKTGLYETGRIKRKKTGAIIETVIIAAFLGLQIYNLFTEGFQSFKTSDIFMTAVMAALIPFIWITPAVYEKKYINSIADGTKLYARIFEDVLYIEVEGGEKPTKVLLDKTSVYFENESRFFLVIPNSSVIILPKRYFAENDLITVENRLKNGTLESLDDEKKEK